MTSSRSRAVLSPGCPRRPPNAHRGEQKDNRADTWMSLLKGMRGTLVQKRFKQVGTHQSTHSFAVGLNSFG